jgi:competence protein ComEC
MSASWVLTAIGLTWTAMVNSRVWMLLFAIAGGLLLGLWRGSIGQVDLSNYRQIIGHSITLSGVVSEDADTNQQGQTVLRLRDVHIGNDTLVGMVWVTTNDAADIKRSDRVRLSGKLTEGFGSFAGSMYSVRILDIERPVPGDIPLHVRDYFATGVRKAIKDTEASLGLGYLVGQRRGLPKDLDAALQAAGLTHIVVASGYNLTILVRLARRLFEKISKYLSLLVSSLMIIGFISITGLSPSMSRAGLITGLSILAWYYGRRFHPLVLLPLAMAITLLFQPSYAWGDLGWQLSFAAFAGVMILAPLLQAYFFGDKTERTIRRIFIETIAATVATLPIILVSFGQFSIVSPVANMLILPFIPLAMLLTFVGGVAGMVVPATAFVIGFPAQLLLSYMTGVAQLMGSIPWALQETQISPAAAFVSYVVLAVACMYMSRKTRYVLHRSSLVE